MHTLWVGMVELVKRTMPSVGSTVQIHSLQAQPEYNGLFGTYCGHEIAESGRVRVTVGSNTLSFKQDNITILPADAYPSDVIKKVYDPAVQAVLVEVQRKTIQKLQKKVPLVFDDIVRRSTGGAPTTVDEDTFKRQLDLFTWGLFCDWDAALWKNVLLGGGSVLASLLPMPANFAALKPFAFWG